MFPNAPTSIDSFSEIEELQGKLGLQELDQGLLHTVLENDKETIEEGRIITDAINKGIGAFTPNVLFEQLVQNYAMTQEIYGERLFRYITGFSGDYLARNMRIPEFQREIKRKIADGVQRMKDKKIIDEDGGITKKGIALSSLMLYLDEIDHIIPKGSWGTYVHKKKTHYGVPFEQMAWKKGVRYRDIAVKQSVSRALRRQHPALLCSDLRIHKRENQGKTTVIYALDASGSMKGKKLEAAKKAGIALAFTAVSRKDTVGLVVFKEKVEDECTPTMDFGQLLQTLTKIKPGKETDFVSAIQHALFLFPQDNETKHLIILSDALPTLGKKPEEETVQAVADAADKGITVSFIGISLDAQGLLLAQKIVEIGKGRLHIAKDLEELDRIVIEDYNAVE